MSNVLHYQQKLAPGLLSPFTNHKLVNHATRRRSSQRLSFLQASAQAEANEHLNLTRRSKFLLRACMQPILTRAWLNFLQEPIIRPLWQLRPRLASKLQRPYVRADWKAQQRLTALIEHYQLLPQYFHPSVCRHIYQHGLDLLHIINQQSEQLFALRLVNQNQFEKEGELTLVFSDLINSVDLARLTFCTVRQQQQPVILIGGLQACANAKIRQSIHDSMKGMYGMRPKAFAFWCLQQYAKTQGIQQIQAVSKTLHIYNHHHKKRDFFADYDLFWQESGGEQLADGCWHLPLSCRQRSRDELKASRRKQHELRYAFLQSLQPKLCQALTACKPESNAIGHLFEQSAVRTFHHDGNGVEVEPVLATSDQLSYQYHYE